MDQFSQLSAKFNVMHQNNVSASTPCTIIKDQNKTCFSFKILKWKFCTKSFMYIVIVLEMQSKQVLKYVLLSFFPKSILEHKSRGAVFTDAVLVGDVV